MWRAIIGVLLMLWGIWDAAWLLVHHEKVSTVVLESGGVSQDPLDIQAAKGTAVMIVIVKLVAAAILIYFGIKAHPEPGRSSCRKRKGQNHGSL